MDSANCCWIVREGPVAQSAGLASGFAFASDGVLESCVHWVDGASYGRCLETGDGVEEHRQDPLVSAWVDRAYLVENLDEEDRCGV